MRSRVIGTWQDVREQYAERSKGEANDVVPFARFIVVPADIRDRRDLAQPAKNMLAANVPGVNDVIDSTEHVQDFRPEETVRVADDSDAHREP